MSQERREPTAFDLFKAKYGENWGIEEEQAKRKTAVPAPNVDQLRHHYQHYDLAFKPKTSEAAE